MRRFCHALPTTALVVLLVGAALHANAQITPQPTPDAKLPDDQPAEDEKLLKGAGIGMDGPALVGFLRKLIPTPEDTKRVAALLEQLGDKTFRIREKAVVELKAVGPPALPGLHKVAKGGDLEISRRAERCIQAIEEQMSPAVVLAATRLLKVREAKGAVAVLLDYLPLATEPVSEEVLETLFALGGREGKVDPAIIAALKDATPARCAAAALVVGRYGTPKQRRVVEKLLDDDNLTIRLRAAQGLVCGRDKSAFPALIVLLAKAPLPLAQQAEELLSRVAGKAAPQVFLGEDDKNREQVRKAWDDWWQANKDRLDLAKVDLTSPFASEAMRARTVTRQFLEAIIKGDLAAIRRSTDVPFAIDALMILRTREEADQIFQEAMRNVKQEKHTFKIAKVMSMDDYLKQTMRPPLEFLKQVPKESVRAVIVDGTRANGKVETAAVLVRIQGARARVVGIGEPSEKKK